MLDTTSTATLTSSETELFLENVSQRTNIIIEEIQEQYLEDTIPWVVGFSGGKDSTAVFATCILCTF